MLELYIKHIYVEYVYSRWYSKFQYENCGAFVSFVGIVRDEDGIEGLSFDVHKPILERWFQGWNEKIKAQNAHLLMAHSVGDVMLHEASFMAAVVSPKRRFGLEMLDEFVEDFKTKAPIWKYDLIDGRRVYARKRSTKLPNAGILL